MAEPTASAPAGPPPGRYRKKLLQAAPPAGLIALTIGVFALLIAANFGAPDQAPPATGILAAAEAPDAGAYGGGDCAPVMFIGARGSGETPQSNWEFPSSYNDKDEYGFGAELWSLYQQLQQRAPGEIAFYPVMYPADNVFPDLVNGNLKLYEASVASGASTLVSDIQLVDHACQGQPHHYVLAGYSQGAWVIHDALHTLAAADPSALAEISGVALFGDPDFQPYEPWVRDFKWLDPAPGSATLAGQGYPVIPGQVAARTASYCFPNDPVCQATPWNIAAFVPACLVPYNVACPHFDYVHFGEVTRAAGFLALLLPQ